MSLYSGLEVNEFPEITYEEFYHKQNYIGTLDSLLLETKEIIGKSFQEDLIPSKDLADLILNPPRVIRFILDNKIVNNPKNEHFLNPLLNSVNLSSQIYSNSSGAYLYLDFFYHDLINRFSKEILDSSINQREDYITWWASNPLKSEKTAKKLSSQFKGRPILFVPLAHGGVPAGLDVFLRYNNSENSLNNSFLYPVRYSRCKLNDKFPSLSNWEIDFLRKKAGSNPVVIFDEDVSSGKTAVNALNFFQEEIFPFNEVNFYSNFNSLKEDVYIS